MPDTDSPGTIAALLAANRAQREAIATQLSAAKEELRNLLLRGHAISMEVSEMSTLAGISRDTAHRVIREAGVMSWKEKRDWAHAVLDAVDRDRGDIDQQIFRSNAQNSLYSALGSQSDEIPPSLDAIFESAAQGISEIRGRLFVPRIDKARLAQLPAWPVEPFEMVQRGTGHAARFQLRQRGAVVAPERETAEEVARDLLEHGGKKPTYIDRTGPECRTADGRRVSWELLAQLS